MELKGNQYAKVTERVKLFRSENPNGLIETNPVIQPDGQILFKARVLMDKAEPSSAEGTGHALGANKGDKAFEKLETIAVGRALAFVGYAADGEIASSEEMDEYLEYKSSKNDEYRQKLIEEMESCKTLPALKKFWATVPMSEVKASLEEKKEEMKAILTSESKPHEDA